jgi:hypothetical protein
VISAEEYSSTYGALKIYSPANALEETNAKLRMISPIVFERMVLYQQ